MNRSLKAWLLGRASARTARVAWSLLAAAICIISARAQAAEGRPCGGLQGRPCGDGEYCDFSEEAQCGAADQTGMCKARPNSCTFIYKPVCGCDDQTYPNACAANAAGVSVASQGECGAECTSDADCPHGACEGGVSCAGLDCPPPPPAACTVCGDGSALVCKSLARPCPDGQVREIVDGCYGECVDRHSCEPPAPAPQKQCKYDGKVYYPGENFPATDGCNRCTCEASGKVMCTLRLCTPPTKCDYTNPSRSWVAKDPERCKLVRFNCVSGTRYFSNECGCGCEKSPTPPPKPRCVVGGCSGQLCTDASHGGVVSTCEWRDEYACYRGARCEAQVDGRCGWTMTPELRACLGR